MSSEAACMTDCTAHWVSVHTISLQELVYIALDLEFMLALTNKYLLQGTTTVNIKGVV